MPNHEELKQEMIALTKKLREVLSPHERNLLGSWVCIHAVKTHQMQLEYKSAKSVLHALDCLAENLYEMSNEARDAYDRLERQTEKSQSISDATEASGNLRALDYWLNERETDLDGSLFSGGDVGAHLFYPEDVHGPEVPKSDYDLAMEATDEEE